MSEDSSLSEKAKTFLEKQLHEYEDKIKILKRKRKTVKIAFTTFITTSIICSTICAGLVGFPVPAVVISILSTTGALSTAISMRFKLKRKQNELNRIIEQLNKTKRQIDYIISSNGMFSEKDYKQIIGKLN